LIDKAATDPRLKGLNAIVFLSLKPKGRGINMSPVRNVEAYRKLIEHAFEKNIGIGFDSCGSNIFLEAMKNSPNFKELKQLAEPCESLLMSVYSSVDGKIYPCSFCEDVEEPVDLLADGVTFNDVWHGPVAEKWRNKLLKNCRNCPVYNVGPESSVTEHLVNPMKRLISKAVSKALEE
jgi:radical SAM protein with 4Fe4S-binding SPASM domain